MSFWPGEYCVLCDEYMGCTPRANCATVDHFVPRWMGGKKHKSNEWRICNSCNSSKGARLPNNRETAVFNKVMRHCDN